MNYFNEIRRLGTSIRPTAEAEAGSAPNLDCHFSFLPSM